MDRDPLRVVGPRTPATRDVLDPKGEHRRAPGGSETAVPGRTLGPRLACNDPPSCSGSLRRLRPPPMRLLPRGASPARAHSSSAGAGRPGSPGARHGLRRGLRTSSGSACVRGRSKRVPDTRGCTCTVPLRDSHTYGGGEPRSRHAGASDHHTSPDHAAARHRATLVNERTANGDDRRRAGPHRIAEREKEKPLVFSGFSEYSGGERI